MRITTLFPMPATDGRLRRARLAAAWALGLWFASMYVRMGWTKLEGEGLRVIVGAIELVAGLALVVPWVASYGALALSLVMAGAWGTLAHAGRWADAALVTAYIAGLSWIVYEWWWRRWSVRRRHGPERTERPRA